MDKLLLKQLEDFRHNVSVLERKLYGKETERLPIDHLGDSDIVHIAQDFEGNIQGVFLDDCRALAMAESSDGFFSSWAVENITPVGDLVPVRYHVGQRVHAVLDFGAEVDGTIIWCDDEESHGLDMVIYRISLDMDEGEVGGEAIIAGCQIKRLIE